MNTFRHRGSLGDIIYSIPCILASGGGKLNLEKKFHYDSLNSLLSVQPNLEIGYGREGISLDGFRKINDNKKHLGQCHAEVLNVTVDLTKEWLFNIDPLKEAEIIVNRSRHYHDRKEIDYSLLRDYKDKILFIGKGDEYRSFRRYFVPEVKHRPCKDGLEIARLIKGSKLFIGNQSFCFSLAEAMKHPRALEICYTYDNCRPSGNNWYITLTKDIINTCLSK